MATPLEEYMADLVSQYKLRDSMNDSDYENELTQSQAEEAQALHAIDAQPFRLAARSYNMNPDEWVGKEAEAREKMKQAVSAQYLRSRAGTTQNQAQGKKQSVHEQISVLNRLNSVNQSGIRALEQYVPRDAGLRSQLVFDPKTGAVTQKAKNIPDEDMVRTQEIANYLQLPAHVVREQRVLEQMAENDRLWREERRGVIRDKAKKEEDRAANAELRAKKRDERAEESAERSRNAEGRAQRGEERAIEQAKWANVFRQTRLAQTFSEYSPEIVNDILKDPDATPDMKKSATYGNALRQARLAFAQEQDRARQLIYAKETYYKVLQSDPEFMANVRLNKWDQKEADKIWVNTVNMLDKIGWQSMPFDKIRFQDDFGFLDTYEPKGPNSLFSLQELNEQNRSGYINRTSNAQASQIRLEEEKRQLEMLLGMDEEMLEEEEE